MKIERNDCIITKQNRVLLQIESIKNTTTMECIDIEKISDEFQNET